MSSELHRNVKLRAFLQVPREVLGRYKNSDRFRKIREACLQVIFREVVEILRNHLESDDADHENQNEIFFLSITAF